MFHPVLIELHQTIRGRSAEIALVCTSPVNRAYEQALTLSVRRAEGSAGWAPIFSSLLATPSVVGGTSPAALAALSLRKYLFPNAYVLKGAGATHDMVQWDSDTAKNRPTYGLPPITVVAEPSSWFIDDLEMRRTARRELMRAYTDFLTYSFVYNGPNCAAESEFWIAENDLIAEMEEEGQLIHDSANALVSDQCELVPDMDICIDFFIMNSRSFVFGGNDRDFNTNAGINHSKAHVYFNSTTLAWEVKINSTRLRMGSIEILPVHDSVGLFDPSRDVKVTRLTNGDVQIVARFKNNYCPSADWAPCPTIDATVWLRPDASKPGGFNVFWNRDGYPSMQVNRRGLQSSTYVEMARDPELEMGGWTAWLNLISGRRASHRLPPGCQLQ